MTSLSSLLEGPFLENVFFILLSMKPLRARVAYHTDLRAYRQDYLYLRYYARAYGFVLFPSFLLCLKLN